MWPYPHLPQIKKTKQTNKNNVVINSVIEKETNLNPFFRITDEKLIFVFILLCTTNDIIIISILRVVYEVRSIANKICKMLILN